MAPSGLCARGWFVALALAVSGMAQADVIVLKSGKEVECVVMEETDDSVRIRPAGSGSTIQLRKSSIKEIVRQEGRSRAETRGDEAFMRQDYAQARGRYRAALEQTESDTARDRLNAKIERCANAIVDSNKAFLDQAFQSALAILRQYQFEDIAPAVATVREAVAGREMEGVSPRDIDRAIAMLYYHKADSEMDRLRYSAALGSINRAIEHADDIPALYLLRADLTVKRGGAMESDPVDDYLKGLSLAGEELSEKERADYHFKVGRLLLDTSRRSEAIDHLLRASSLAPAHYRDAVGHAADAYLQLLDELEDMLANADETIVRLKNLIEMYPNTSQAVTMKERLANLYLLKERHEDAIATLQSVLEDDPNRIEIHYRIAGCHLKLATNAETDSERLAHLERAEEHLKAEIDINPRNYEALCELGDLYYRTQRFDRARERLREAIDLEPTKWRAYRIVMYVEKRLGDLGTEYEYDRAVAHADELAALRRNEPEFYEALMLKANIMTRRRQWAQAQELLDIVLAGLEERAPGELTDAERAALSSCYNYRGVIAQERDGQVHFAEAQYLKAIETDPSNPESYHNLANVNIKLASSESAREGKNARYRKAEKAFKKAIELDPLNPDRYQYLGYLYYRDLKELDNALEQFEKYKEHGGRSSQVDKALRDIRLALR